jgi:hypothetical protein
MAHELQAPTATDQKHRRPVAELPVLEKRMELSASHDEPVELQKETKSYE